MKKENPKTNKLLAVMVSATLATGMVPAIALADDDNQQARKSVSEMIEEAENGQDATSDNLISLVDGSASDAVSSEEDETGTSEGATSDDSENAQPEDGSEQAEESGIALQAADGADASAELVDSIISKGGSLKSGTYTLDEDITFVEENLTIPAGEVVAIDLNGHKLVGNGNGSVIKVLGSLTIEDNSGSNSGIITGGNAEIADDSDHLAGNIAAYNGGGIFVDGGGSLHLVSGGISGNQACNGGGVYVMDNASFVMDGGFISNNNALRNYHGGAGGVYVYGIASAGSFGEFTMNGGVITGNTSRTQGGGIFSTGILTINNGEISGNTAPIGGGLCSNYLATINDGLIECNYAKYVEGTGYSEVGAGGVINNGGTLNLNGGSIKNNSLNSTAPAGVPFNLKGGGGVYSTGTINMKDSPVIADNTVDGKTDNCMVSSSLIQIVGQLSDSAKIGVNVNGDMGRVTGDLGGFVPDSVFFSDHPGVELNTIDGSYYLTKTVTDENAVCYVMQNGKRVNFDALASAVAYYPIDDNKITLVKDIDLAQQIVLTPGTDVVLTADDEHVISWTGDHTGSFFNVKKDSALSIEGKVVVKGNRTSDDYFATSTDQRAFTVNGLLTLGKEGDNSGYPKVQDFTTVTEAESQSGGAIYINTGGSLVINGGTYSHNRASAGGVLYTYQNSGTIEIHGGTFTNNVAQRTNGQSDSKGGCIYVGNLPSLTIDGGVFDGNKSYGVAGVISANNSKLNIGSNVQFINNEALLNRDNTNGFGGAIYFENGSKASIAATFKNNKATSGGAIYAGVSSELSLDNGCVFDSNNAVRKNTSEPVSNANPSSKGGAIYANRTTLNIADARIGNNTANLGGGVYLNRSTFNMDKGTLKNNSALNEAAAAYSAQEGRGGALYAEESQVVLNDGSIESNHIVANEGVNTGGLAGAGVCISGTTSLFEMNGGSISDNSGANMGGGLYVTSCATAKISSGSIVGNSADNGAGIFVSYNVSSDGSKFTTLEMSGGLVSGNVSTGNSANVAGVQLNTSGNNNTGILKLSGSPIIQGNGKSGDMNYGVYLPKISKIKLMGEMAQGASVVVSTGNSATAGSDVQVTEAEADTEYYKSAAQYFVPAQKTAYSASDDSGKYVKFTAGENSYNVTFDLSHAAMESGPSVVKVKNGESLTTTLTAKEGYTLPESIEGVDSYTRAADGKTADVTINQVNEAKTISVAGVANQYEVAFNANGGEGEMSSIEGAYNSDITLPQNTFTRTNYTFTGWNTASNGTGTSYADAATVRNLTSENGATVTLYAQWSEKQEITLDETPQSVTYNAQAQQFKIKSAPVSDGFSVSYVLSNARAAANGNPVDAGTYDVTITRAEDATYQSFNKTIPGGLVISKATDRASVSLSDKEVTYTGSAIEAPAAVVTVEGQVESAAQVTYKYYSDEACANEIAGAPTDAGTYYVKAFWSGDNNHEAAESLPAKLSIKNASFSVTVTGWSGEYDGKPHGATVESSTEGVKVSFGESADECTLDASPEYTEPGEYTIYYRASLANYDDVEGSVKVVITKAVVPTPEPGKPGTSGTPTASGSSTTTTTTTTTVSETASTAKSQSSKTGDNLLALAGGIALVGAAAISLGVMALRRLKKQ